MNLALRMFVLVFALLAFTALTRCQRADAGTATVSWQEPPSNCDGTAINGPLKYRVLWGRASALLEPPQPGSYTVAGLTPGLWWFGVTAIDTEGLESPIGGPDFKTIVPEDFRVASTTVYTVVKRTDRFVLLPVGEVPEGTVCLADQTVNGYFAVPRAAVTWAGSVRPDIVVADCE